MQIRRFIAAGCCVFLLAAAPNRWALVSGASNVANTASAGLARTPDGTLHVMWQSWNRASYGLMQNAIASNGAVGTASKAIWGWGSASNPALLAVAGGLRVFFGGQHSTQTTDPNQSLNTAAESGGSWVLQRTPAADASANTEAPAAAIAKDGTFITAWQAMWGLGVHAGISPNTPTTRFEMACCVYNPWLATDSATGEVVAGWYSNASQAGGQFMKAVYPNASAVQYLPGSASADRNSSVEILQPAAIAARQGASGVFAAYGSGYPSFTRINVIRFGGSPVGVARTQNAGSINIAAAPQGRMWIMWTQFNRIYVTLSNRAVTRFSAIVSPALPAGVTSLYHVQGEGSRGPLDLLALAVSSGKLGWWHLRIPVPAHMERLDK